MDLRTDDHDPELAVALGGSLTRPRSEQLAEVRRLADFWAKTRPDTPEQTEAAEIAYGRLYDAWFESGERTPGSVNRFGREAFRAGERHQAAWEALRAADRVWIDPDAVPMDMR